MAKFSSLWIIYIGYRGWYQLKDEFCNGYGFEYFLENTDPELVNFQMDLYWVTKAGADPLAYFKKYPGRFISAHLSDWINEDESVPIGQGMVDWPEFVF